MIEAIKSTYQNSIRILQLNWQESNPLYHREKRDKQVDSLSPIAISHIQYKERNFLRHRKLYPVLIQIQM